MGWKILGDHHGHLKKKILIVIPHTSNWDFPLGILVRTIIDDKIKFIGKSSLFKPPHGFIFKLLGGIPVDRSKTGNFVDAVVKKFDHNDKLNIVLAPEGTRSKVDKLKTGFYYIAYRAKVPIIMVKFDFNERVVTFAEPFYANGNYESDFEVLRDFYSGSVGKNPDWGFFNS